MFSPSSFTASTPCVTADCACSTTPVATRFTRASGDDFARSACERFGDERLADGLLHAAFFAAPFLTALRAAAFFAAPFARGSGSLRAGLLRALLGAALLRRRALGATLGATAARRALASASLAAAFLLRCHRCVSSAGWLALGAARVVNVCARFGRTVASGDPAARVLLLQCCRQDMPVDALVSRCREHVTRSNRCVECITLGLRASSWQCCAVRPASDGQQHGASRATGQR